jgi:N-acetylmuramoyl-L-alanine amidase
VKSTFTLIRLGTEGSEVAEVCEWLARVGLIENTQTYFDEKVEFAIRKFQQDKGLSVDGIVGPETFRRLEEARWLLGDRVLSYTPGHLIHGDDVASLQRKLNDLGFDSGRVDGVFGIRTFTALQEFQKGIGISPDGICGLEVFKAFARLTRVVTGGSPEELRDSLKHEFKKTGIANKVILIDSEFIERTFKVNDMEVNEAEILLDITRRLEGKLSALGTTTLLTRGSDYQDEVERAHYANQSKVDLVISLHLDALESTLAKGCATFYFGNEPRGTRSMVGGQLAELVQNKLCQISSIVDCGVHPKTWDLLRLTRMPAVKVALGYLTNSEDAANFTNQNFRDQVAASISEATKEFFQPAEH